MLNFVFSSKVLQIHHNRADFSEIMYYYVLIYLDVTGIVYLNNEAYEG